MAPLFQLSPRGRVFFDNYLSIILTLAFFGAVILVARYWEHIGEKSQPMTIETNATKLDASSGPMPTVVKPGLNPASPPAPTNPPTPAGRVTNKNQPAAQNLPTVIGRTPSIASPSQPGAIDPSRIQVVDGDTVRLDGKSFRLVGIDTPESGALAKCEAERQLGARASKRLREIVASGGLRLDRVACADCPPGTEGTPACNYGRFCGVLTAAGRDVGLVLIGEGLAKRYNCSASQCPPKQAWCSG